MRYTQFILRLASLEDSQLNTETTIYEETSTLNLTSVLC